MNQSFALHGLIGRWGTGGEVIRKVRGSPRPATHTTETDLNTREREKVNTRKARSLRHDIYHMKYRVFSLSLGLFTYCQALKYIEAH